MDKERAWYGLLMTVFINWHSAFFMTEIIHGDKNTFKLGFDSTATPYAIVTKPLYYQGWGCCVICAAAYSNISIFVLPLFIATNAACNDTIL